jgi:hypothetical protein
MVVGEEYQDLHRRLEELLKDLDSAQLDYVAVHVDLALRRFEERLSVSASVDQQQPVEKIAAAKL